MTDRVPTCVTAAADQLLATLREHLPHYLDMAGKCSADTATVEQALIAVYSDLHARPALNRTALVGIAAGLLLLQVDPKFRTAVAPVPDPTGSPVTPTEEPYAARTPRLEQFTAKWVGRLISWLARRAKTRGDMHEFRHMQAAANAGNSQPCERAGRCHLTATGPVPTTRYGVAPVATYADLYPNGRTLHYEGDLPAAFAAQIKHEFGFDPSTDPQWGQYIPYPPDDPTGEPGFTSYAFYCPVQHLEAIYCSERWPLGS